VNFVFWFVFAIIYTFSTLDRIGPSGGSVVPMAIGAFAGVLNAAFAVVNGARKNPPVRWNVVWLLLRQRKLRLAWWAIAVPSVVYDAERLLEEPK
jgi:hypothetical protein